MDKMGDVNNVTQSEVRLPTKEECKEYHLKEYEGSICSKCNTVYYIKKDKCDSCGEKTEQVKWYKRFSYERLAFLFSFPVLIVILTQIFFSEKPNIFLVYFISVACLFSLYYTAYFFIGVGSFWEKFTSLNLPNRVYKKFSMPRYLSEIFHIILIALGLTVLFGIIALIRSALEC
jgi:hypothetical protein